MRKLGLLQVCLGYLLFFIGCGGGGGGENLPSGGVGNPPGNGGEDGEVAQVQGNWSATLTSTVVSGSQTTVDMFIKQRGKTITADLNQLFLKNSPCSEYGTMSGTISGNDVTLTIQEGGVADKVMLTGTLSNSVLTGTYTTSGSCTSGDTGNFSARVVPDMSSGSWTGEAVSSSLGVANFIVSLNERLPAGALPGSISFLDLPCVTSLDISAGQMGGQFNMGNWDVGWFGSGRISEDGKTITGEYTNDNICGSSGDTSTWNFTMSRP